MITTKTPLKRKPTLRDAQKAQTRQRLLDGARIVFYREGYYSATVDQIVAEIGASRPTFYLHFRDKEEVLAELMAIYAARTAPYMQRVPGPRPTVEALTLWLGEVGDLLGQERALFSLVHEVSAHKQSKSPPRPHYGLATVDNWIAALSHRSPAFAAAARKEERDLEARARAELLVIEIVWSGTNVAQARTSPFTEMTVSLVAKALHDFMNDPRYHTRSVSSGARSNSSQARRKGRSS